MNILRITFFFCILSAIHAVAIAQVDSTGSDSTAADSNAAKIVVPDSVAADSMAADSVVIDSIPYDSTRPDSLLPDSLQADSIAADSAAIDTVTYDSTLVHLDKIVRAREYSVPDSAEKKKPLFKVIPWQFHAPISADTAETDSTLRWEHWSDWTYNLNRKPGVISYRMGNSDRTNAVQRYTYGPQDQELFWEDIKLNDPVSGALHWSLIPQNKIEEFYEQDLGTKFRSTYTLEQYYLNEPLTRLIYSESKFSQRDLEFEVSHNLSQKTNIEASYLDRSIGGEYDNTATDGRQIFVKASHNLDKRRYLKLNYINTSYNVGRPFGFTDSDLRTFAFDRYRATPQEPRAKSDEKSSILALNFYQRAADSLQAIDNLHAGLFYRGTGRKLKYSADTTSYRVNALGVHAKKWWKLGGLQFQGGGSYQYFINKGGVDKNLATSNWSLLNAEGALSLDYTPVVDLDAAGSFKLRSDGYQGFRLGASTDLSVGKFTLTPGLATESRMPTPQQLYWKSAKYSGNKGLQNEQIQSIRASLKYDISPNFNVGIKAQHKEVKDGIMMGDSVFANLSPYASQAGSIFMNWKPTHWEFNGSATAQQFTNSYFQSNQPNPLFSAKKVWLKGSIYWKGDVLSDAAYLKAGLSGMMSPFNYQPDHYNPVLDYWQPKSTDQLLPLYNRLDVDISARVRWIFFIFRWENVLDDVAQLGYFETAGYPMISRRLVFTVRAIFRN